MIRNRANRGSPSQEAGAQAWARRALGLHTCTKLLSKMGKSRSWSNSPLRRWRWSRPGRCVGQAGTRGRSTWAAKFAGLFQEAGPRSPGQPRAEGRGFPATGLRIAGSIPHLVPSPGPTPPGPAPPLTCHPTWSRLTCSTRGRLRLVPPFHRNAPPLGGSGGRSPRRKREGGAPGSVTSQRDGPGVRHGGDVRDCGVIQGAVPGNPDAAAPAP